MEVRYFRLGTALLTAASFALPVTLQAAESRRLEEVVVTAERKESSVQDTSISITAFTSEMMDDFGIRNQSDLQNLVPATTIQPYDSAVRGVGRNFRNLGGDPGVATYMNGVYSEDLYTATIGSFWDVERIEVLRGPQGTLYGRNAVGGAMNFLYKKPSSEFEFAAKGIVGEYGTQDAYFMVNAPLVEDVLNARLVGSSREHDGWVQERGPVGDDLDSGDETNIALSIEWIMNDDMTFNLRQNKADVDRVMGGAQGGGLVVLTGENIFGNGLRDTTRVSHGLRAVDATVTDPLSSLFVDQTQGVLNFTNPTTGANITAQYTRPGVDNSPQIRNPLFGSATDQSDCTFTDRENIKGDDLCAYTNGFNSEIFDQQGTQAEFSWDISDAVQFKYIFGYNTLLYERTTDDDSSANQNIDRQFYVNHEAEYVSHELQLFWDVSDSLSFTSGIFFYDSVIDQRYDFYSAGDKYSNPSFGLDGPAGGNPGPSFMQGLAGLIAQLSGNPAAATAELIPGVPLATPLGFLFGADNVAVGVTGLTHQSAKIDNRALNSPVGQFNIVTGPWLGGADYLGNIENGPAVGASDVTSTNKTEREAFAAYTQGVWDINDKFTLTFGLRYAEDDVRGEELLGRYSESGAVLTAFGQSNVAFANIVRGAIDGSATLADGVTPNPNFLQPTGLVEPWLEGTPIVFGAFREVARVDDDITGRLNLDYNWTDDVMIYGNVTTGYRSGGFNLAFFSDSPQYEPEQLAAYELGLKGQYLDSTLQVNASAYFYDYESIHTFTEEACDPSDTLATAQSACAVVDSTSSVQAAPGAEVKGAEVEVMWLASDAITLGGNFSFTQAEFTESFFVVDGADPSVPGSIYDITNEVDRRRDINGRRLPNIPEQKLSIFGNYEIPLASNGRVNLLANYSWIDEVYFGSFEAELDRAPAYDRIDVRATWTSPSESWIVSGFVNNVTDDIGIRFIERHGYEDGYRRTAQVTEPRVFGLEVSYTFMN
jgi:outer membrane receptor protein involved in Fe transport